MCLQQFSRRLGRRPDTPELLLSNLISPSMLTIPREQHGVALIESQAQHTGSNDIVSELPATGAGPSPGDLKTDSQGICTDQLHTATLRFTNEIKSCRVYQPSWLSANGSWCPDIVSVKSRNIHGTHLLPSGYDLALVPAHFDVCELTRLDQPKQYMDIATSSSPVTVAVGLYQIIYGAATLYLARGDQIQLYGYASFSLTVIPYILMTALNLFAQLLTEDYPALYMLETDIMSEARKRGGLFEGMVGRLGAYDETDVSRLPFVSPEEDLGAWVVETTGDTDKFTLSFRKPLLDHYHRDPEHRMELKDLGMNTSEELPEQSLNFASLHEAAARPQNDQQEQRPIRWTWMTIFAKRSPSSHRQESVFFIPCCSLPRTRDGTPGKPQGYWPSKNKYAVSYLKREFIVHAVCPLVFSAAVLAIIAGFSRFRTGSLSTPVQRGLTMTWIIFGTCNGALALTMNNFLQAGFVVLNKAVAAGFKKGGRTGFDWLRRLDGLSQIYVLVGSTLVYAAPAVAGMVVAGMQMKAYGDCTRVDGPF